MSYALTELQLAVITVLWERGEATVLDVHDVLREERRVAQATIATLLSRMEERGLVQHRTEGRQNVYRAVVQQEEVSRSIVSEFAARTERLFANPTAELLKQLLDIRQVGPDDLARAREIIEARERALREQEGEE